MKLLLQPTHAGTVQVSLTAPHQLALPQAPLGPHTAEAAAASLPHWAFRIPKSFSLTIDLGCLCDPVCELGEEGLPEGWCWVRFPGQKQPAGPAGSL